MSCDGARPTHPNSLSSENICDSDVTPTPTMVVSNSVSPAACSQSIDAPGGGNHSYEELECPEMDDCFDSVSSDKSGPDMSLGKSLQSSDHREGSVDSYRIRDDGLDVIVDEGKEDCQSCMGSLRSMEELGDRGGGGVSIQKNPQRLERTEKEFGVEIDKMTVRVSSVQLTEDKGVKESGGDKRQQSNDGKLTSGEQRAKSVSLNTADAERQLAQPSHGAREREASINPEESSSNYGDIIPHEESLHSTSGVHSLHSSQSESSISRPLRSTSPSSYSRSHSLPNSKLLEFYDIFLIYNQEDEETNAQNFRSFAENQKWKVTSIAELPAGQVNLRSFCEIMECCSYVVLLISSHFLSDKKCERLYNIAIEYGDKHEEFYECVLPVVFGHTELPPDLEAITRVTWGNAYFDNVMRRSVQLEKRLRREQEFASRYGSLQTALPHRTMSVDTSMMQMPSSSTSHSSLPTPVPVCGTASQQTSKQPEQEACLMPSEESSRVLPPIYVDVSATTPTTLSQHTTVATIHQPPRDTVLQQQATSSTYQPQSEVRPYSSTTYLPQQQQPQGVVLTRQATSPTSHIYQPQTDVARQSSATSFAQQPQTLQAAYPPAQMYPQQRDIYRQCSTGLPPPPHQQYQATAVVSPPIQHSVVPGAPFARSSSAESRYHSQASQEFSSMSGEEIFRQLTEDFSPGQASSQMLSMTRFGQICELLDPPDPRGCDWTLLAEIFELTPPQIKILEQRPTGKTKMLLEIYFLKREGLDKIEILKELSEYLRNINRDDAAGHVDKEIMIAKCRKVR